MDAERTAAWKMLMEARVEPSGWLYVGLEDGYYVFHREGDRSRRIYFKAVEEVQSGRKNTRARYGGSEGPNAGSYRHN